MSNHEDQELITRISRLTSQINRHKAQRDGPNFDPNYPFRSSYHRVTPYHRGSYRGSRGKPLPSYRNKTLVLNGQARPASTREDDNENSDSSSPSFIAKTDRHMQLINSSVYEKETQQRANAIGQTLRQKQLQRNQRERARFMSSIAQNGSSGTAFAPPNPAVSQYEVVVDGVRFRVVQQGSKLIKAPDDVNPPAATPKVATIGGVKFHRTKNGNLVRHGIVKAQRLIGGVKKVNEQCKAFSWTGSCSKGPICRYIHDPSKTAICRDWLVKGTCASGDNCDLSHEITQERTPLCMHFAKGKCNNPSCSYIHVEHSQNDPVCRAFGIYGYCEKGEHCPDRHVFECPDWSNTGVCRLKGCKRPHTVRASALRKAGVREPSEEMEDLSSGDDEASADSDDIDSDAVEEFIEKDDEDLDLDADFIGFK
ncbi:hypothetical protein F4779DRAFT_574198 [Xylariaceae sp. FL0662B]|nr:hypothetical protein F4779DRAFT_574198 [Xylariaceae sp. FL0662B]